jgi:hypothetical protein
MYYVFFWLYELYGLCGNVIVPYSEPILECHDKSESVAIRTDKIRNLVVIIILNRHFSINVHLCKGTCF